MVIHQLICRCLLALTLVTSLPALGFSQGGFLDGLRGQVQRELGGAAQQFGSEIRGGFIPNPGSPSPNDGRPRSFGAVPGESGRNNQPDGYFNPQPGFGQPNYGQPDYGQPNYGQPGSRPPISSTPSYSQPPLRSATHNGKAINVRCPKQNGVSINYELIVDGRPYPYSMGPGEKQTFNDTRLWLIRYTSAGSNVTYRLVGGTTYEFDNDPQGNPQLYRSEQYAEPPTRK